MSDDAKMYEEFGRTLFAMIHDYADAHHDSEGKIDADGFIDAWQSRHAACREAEAERDRIKRQLDNLRAAHAKLREAATAAKNHVVELEEAWRTGAIDERDGRGGARSNRNVDVRVALSAALAESDPQ